MSVQHIKSLLFKSARLQEEIEKEQRRRWPDWMRLLKLKKVRLSIKDRIERMVRVHAHGQLQPVHIKVRRTHWHKV